MLYGLITSRLNYLHKKMEKFKGNGEKLFDLTCDITGNIKNSLHNDGILKENLASKFCYFFVYKITCIRKYA